MEENETTEGQQAPTPAEQAQARDAADAELLQGLLTNEVGAAPVAAQEATEGAAPATEGGDASEGSTPDEKALEDARAELNRAKIHKDIIEALTPEQLLTQAETLKGLRGERDREFNQQDALMKRLEALEARGAAESTDTEAGSEDAAQPTEAPAGGPDMSKALQPVDADLYEGIPEALTMTAQVMAGYAEERIAEAVGPVVEQVQNLMQEVVRRELAGQYPQLRDDAAFGKVKQAMAEIQPRVQVEGGSAFDQVYAVMGRASQIELGGAGVSLSESPPQNGGLVAPKKQPAPASPMSADDKAKAWLAAALPTGSAEAGNRAAGL